MSKIAKKLQVGTAAAAVTVATALAQAPSAQATPAVPAPEFIGSALGTVGCLVPVFDSNECQANSAATFGNLFYLGPRDQTPPPRVDFLVLHPEIPLSLIPVVGPILAGWWMAVDFEVCVGGLSARAGGYDGLRASIGSSC